MVEAPALHAVGGRRRSITGLQPRLLAFVIATIAAGAPIVATAAAMLAVEERDDRILLGVAVFFACAVAAELKPLSLDVANTRVVSLAFIFIVSANVLFGWEYGVAVGVGAMFIAQLTGRAPALRLSFNCAVYAIAAFASAAVSLAGLRLEGGAHYGRLTAVVFAHGAIFLVFNVTLVCVAMALVENRRALPVIADHLRHSGAAFLIMGSMAALAVALWTVDPPLLVLLAGPILTLGLYQRYARSTRVARLDAETDSLTGLGNHRAYKHAVRAAADGAARGSPASLCLVDVDNFKRVNDSHGHAAGDEALVEVAAQLAGLGGGTAFRLGGDEFALLLDCPAQEAADRIENVQEALAAREVPLTISTGIASCPASADEVEQLQPLADIALYWTKRNGKRRWCIYTPSVVERSAQAEIVASAEYGARLHALENIVRLVDSRELSWEDHSQAVAEIVGELGERLGFEDETLKRLRLAARLHDLGKIGVPDRIVYKPGPLDPDEVAIMRRHPEMGYELLEGLDASPVDTWILAHHEHWDGSGYPDGLCGEEIPLGSRIILVADAYHAMTNDRGYRAAMDRQSALAELVRGSGRQFDPTVVRTFIELMHPEMNVVPISPVVVSAA